MRCKVNDRQVAGHVVVHNPVKWANDHRITLAKSRAEPFRVEGMAVTDTDVEEFRRNLYYQPAKN